MSLLRHLARRADWEQALETGSYLPPGFADEGFVHLSTAETLPLPANLLYARHDGLVLLWIDPDRLTAELRYEPGGDEVGDVLFPHLYGPLPVDAVVAVTPLQAWEPGAFVAPPAPEGW